MTFMELRRAIEELRVSTPESDLILVVLNLFKAQWDNFDPAARREADRILDGWIRMGLEKAKEELPDFQNGPRRRKIERIFVQGEEKHFNTHDALAVLEGKSQQKNPIVERSGTVFHLALQTAADFLFDARKENARGKKFIVIYGLLHGLIDELLVAFHLAARAFVTQSYAHIRTVEEVLDAVDLLSGDKNLLEQWINAKGIVEEKDVFRKMRNASRKKLASDRGAKLYPFLSAVGPHAQFRNLKARAALSDGIATLFFVGSPKHIETANILAARAAVALVSAVVSVFGDRLDPEEAQAELNKCVADLENLMKDYALPMAEQIEITASELEQALRLPTFRT